MFRRASKSQPSAPSQPISSSYERERPTPIHLAYASSSSPYAVQTGNTDAVEKAAETQHEKRGSWAGPAPSITLSVEADYDIVVDSDVHSLVSSPANHSTALSNFGLSPVIRPRRDKAAQVLGIPHRRSMEPIPSPKAVHRHSTRSATYGYGSTVPATIPESTPPTPLTSLYLVSGLPKSHHAWTLADPDSVLGLQHSDSAVNKWWRPEVLGSTVSPGVQDPDAKGKRRRKKSNPRDPGAAIGLGKADVAKMLSKSLKLSFTREVEIIASTLQPPSTVHTFTFTLPAATTPVGRSNADLRASVYSSTTGAGTEYAGDPTLIARPSSTYLGPPLTPAAQEALAAESAQATTYHGVCLTVWSHADEERSAAIRRTVERVAGGRREAIPPVPSLPHLREAGVVSKKSDSSMVRSKSRGPWSGTDGETDAETDGGLSESDWEGGRSGNVGESTLFLPGDTVFWLPYALTLVSRFPIYDLMRDYLTFSWARFSKDVQSHTLQIAKILSCPAPKPGDIIKLDASPKEAEGSLEMICRMPGGLDFGKGLVDVNFQMWPLFSCLSIENILTICEIALSPTGRILFLSKHPAMLGIAVSTIKYLCELRGWSGVTLPALHSRDAKIYLEDPGPWIIGMATEARYVVRIAPEVCVCDLDINYVNCSAPPVGSISQKGQREKYRRRLMTAFDSFFHPDHSIPSDFKEAFPAGRFRSVCKIQAKRGASSSINVETISSPEWWQSTKVVQAFNEVLQARDKKPSLLKRITTIKQPKKQAKLTAAELLVQLSLRKRATAFVDARDDLETKIGRLTRRLNFLLTESDLWREKFVTFEQYAGQLASEATELRTKIGKEQRESRRLTSLVTMTTQEKAKLQNQLADTEGAHRAAVEELERMRNSMSKMEEERAQMVAEVEAQIERALASMMVGPESDVDWASEDLEEIPTSPTSPRMSGARRPSSSRSVHSNRSRPGTAQSHTSRLRKLADTIAEKSERRDHSRHGSHSKRAPLESSDDADAEGDKTVTKSKTHRRRFSATPVIEDTPGESAMGAVDEGIAQRSDQIAEKVKQIQEQLETALAEEVQAESEIEPANLSEGEMANAVDVPLPLSNPSTRPSTAKSGSLPATPTLSSGNFPPVPPSDVTASPTLVHTTSHLRKISSGASLSAMRQASPTPPASATTAESMSSAAISSRQNGYRPSSVMTLTTDESDTDFQSAYSTSPRGTDFYQHSGSEGDKETTLWERRNSRQRSSTLVNNDKRKTFGSIVVNADAARSRGSSIGTNVPSTTGSEGTVVAPA